jgi:hypothetical protein
MRATGLDFVAMDDVIADLERLTRLRDAGALTQAEFEAQKARLLDPGAGAGAAGTAGPPRCAGCGAPLQLDVTGHCVYCHELQPAAAGAPLAPGAAASMPSSADAADDEIVRLHPKNKIEAIKALRQQTGLDLKAAKDRIEASYRRLGL